MSEPKPVYHPNTGRMRKKGQTIAGCLGLQSWAVALSRRAAGFSQPGIYAFALIVHEDGRRQLVVNQTVENLGGEEKSEV